VTLRVAQSRSAMAFGRVDGIATTVLNRSNTALTVMHVDDVERPMASDVPVSFSTPIRCATIRFHERKRHRLGPGDRARPARVRRRQWPRRQGDKFPKHIYHSIVCIGALVARADADHWAVDALGAPHVGERTEKQLISTFVDKIAELNPQLVTFNGNSFDLPVLRYRAMINAVSAPGLAERAWATPT
jgi:Predicted 3'-5' exonuclease related to the exonuclease domain of PolB